MGFLDNLDPRQKKILMIGAPVVGIAAIYSISRGGPDDEEDQDVVTDEATGGTGVGQVGVIPGGQSTGAVGVGELSSFLGNVSDALRTYRDANAEAIAALRADNQDWQALLEEQLAGRFDQEKPAPTQTPISPAPVPTLAPSRFGTTYEQYMAGAPPENTAADGTISQAFLDYQRRAAQIGTTVVVDEHGRQVRIVGPVTYDRRPR